MSRIEFATRISDDVAKRIKAAVAKLGSDVFSEREQASKELLKIGVPAYAALKEALKSDDQEVKRHAEELVSKIEAGASAEVLEVRKDDVIHTKDMKIKGQIENVTFKTDFSALGPVQLKLADMRTLRSLAFVEPEADTLVALPDPGSLIAYQNQFGKKLAFTVTGQVGGSVWGTGTYTLDSTLATAAVHAGVLQQGQTGVVKVEIVPSLPAYAGSMQNGVRTGGWGPFPQGAFKFIIRDVHGANPKPEADKAPVRGNEDDIRGGPKARP